MRKLLRSAAVLAAAAVVTTGLTAPAQAAPDDDGGAWLSRQLTDGLVVGEYKTDPEGPTWVEYEDYGLSADVAFALQRIGGKRAVIQDIRAALEPKLASWTTGGADVYSGSVAKALTFAQTTGGAEGYGGVDLVAQLEGLVATEAPITGRIEDVSETDFANSIGQSFAVRALAAAESEHATATRAFLLKQQCSAGFFRLGFSAKGRDDQTCDGARRADRRPDTDVTALVLLNLQALKTKPRAVRVAIRDGVRWLKRTQRANGSYGGGTSTKAPNANSTGLAAWALAGGNACPRAERAASWVRKLQLRNVAGTPLAGNRGAIAYDPAALKAGRKRGIARGTRQDQWRRATSQAAPSLRSLGKRC